MLPERAQRPLRVSSKWICIETAVQKFAGGGGEDTSPVPFPPICSLRAQVAEQQLHLCEDALAKWSEEI